MLADVLFKTLFRSGRVAIAVIVIGGIGAINLTWVRTVPNCITAGYYSDKDDSALGCWPAGTTRETLRQHAFEEWARQSEYEERYRRNW